MAIKDNFHEVLVQELNASCDMIKLAIENMDEDSWAEEHNEWSYVMTLFHIIDTIEQEMDFGLYGISTVRGPDGHRQEQGCCLSRCGGSRR